MTLFFPVGRRPRVNDAGTLLFEARNEDGPLVCEIEGTLLLDRFYARSLEPADLVEAFLTNRDRIQAAAAAKLPQRVAAGLRPVLRNVDF